MPRSLTIFILGGGGCILKLYFRIGYSVEFGTKFQPLQQAHASQIVSQYFTYVDTKRCKKTEKERILDKKELECRLFT